MEDKIEDKVNFDDLLVKIKSTRNVNEIKHKLDRDHWIDARDKQWEEDGRKAAEKAREKRQRKQKKLPFEVDEAEEQAELQAAQAQRQKDRQRKKVLDAPLHRQAQQRIEGRLAYRQTKNELRQWQPIVDGLRQAEQLQFPHEERQDNPLRVETAEERANGFTPRTELELRIAEALGNSKSNIRNNEEFSEAEKELLKAMDLKEAKRKCEELRKMRALVSFHAAKMKRQSRIKSKQFHRVRKRQQRRELIKEVEGLLVRDPARAGERVEELERDRAYERATLKHRGTNKWTKQVRKFASRNPELRKVMEDQLRLGRELKGKHGAEGEGEDSGSDELMDEFDEEETVKQPESSQQMVHKAAEMAAADQLKVGDASSGDKLSTTLDNPFCRTALENIRRERKVAAKQARTRAASSAGGDNAHSKTGMDGIGEGKAVDQPDFLDLNVRQIVQIPSELADGIDLDADLQHSFLADAYEDDGVIEEFQARKEKEEEGPGENKPSRYALMRGWGSWTGEGISEEREKQRMDRILGQEVKKKDNRRKYAQQKGVIIREPVSEGVQKLQPRDVPFPFTRIQDFEAYIQQPLGRDWNTSIAHQQLTQPPVATKAGRIIAPLSKEVKYRRKQFTEMIIGQQD